MNDGAKSTAEEIKDRHAQIAGLQEEIEELEQQPAEEIEDLRAQIAELQEEIEELEEQLEGEEEGEEEEEEAATKPARGVGVMTTKQTRLSWWHLDDKNVHWASGCRGRGHYMITPCSDDRWSVDHRRGPQGSWRRQLGTAVTIAEAKAIAQANYDLVTQTID
jgi:TolA-binding protein